MDTARLEKLATGAAEMGLQLSAAQISLIGRHADLLLKWNRSINLTSITDPDEVVEKHLLDSLAVAPAVPAGMLLDAGSGAGFPGIPVAIARPDVKLILAESVQKKAAFLKNVLAELRLPGARVAAVRLQGNAEREGLVRVEAAVARALAAPPDWLTLAGNYLLPGGVAICMLGPTDDAPERVAGLVRASERAYLLPFSKARRRLAIYRRA